MSQPTHGTLSGSAPALTYTPDPDYAGPDSFTFSANDGTVDSDTATVSITVSPVNDGPVLAPIGDRTVAEGATLSVALSGSDIEGDELTFAMGPGAPAWATLTDNGDGTASLELSPGFADGGTMPSPSP